MGYDVHVYSINRAKLKERTKGLTPQEIIDDFYYLTVHICYEQYDESDRNLYNLIHTLGYTVENDGYLEITEDMFSQLKKLAGDKKVSDFLNDGDDGKYNLERYWNLLQLLYNNEINFKDNIVVFEHDW